MTSQAILVLGMHRSGTSALTRTINLLGVEMGSNFYQGPVNPRGYWEHAEIVKINDAIVSRFVGQWTSPDPFPEHWWMGDAVRTERERLREIIARDFGSAPLWGLKDPRLCVLLPLYLALLDDLQMQPLFVHAVRNPVDVILSLQKRDGTPVEYSLLLWCRYVLDAFYHSYPYRCAYTSYERLLGNWGQTTTEIAEQLGITWPISPEAAGAKVDEYLSADLRSFSTSSEGLEGSGDLFEWSVEIYRTLTGLVEGSVSKHDAKRLFDIRAAIDRALQR